MSNLKATKRAFLSGIIAIVLCISMFVGTTFAWFTDTASTAVNKIQAGTLDIELQYATAWGADGAPTVWGNAEGKTLEFRKAAGHESEAVLWEPGCTYELPAIRIKNNGNLALKYKLAINGIKGDAALNRVIEWTNGTTGALLTEYAGTMIPGENNDVTEPIVIKGHMSETAGNEYQGLSIDGIGITVVATQYTYENDGIDNQYDKDAVYPVITDLINVSVEGNITVAGGGTLSNETSTETSTVTIVVPANAVSVDTNAVFSMELMESKPDSVTYEISLKDQEGNAVSLSEKATVTAYIGKDFINVAVAHNGTPMDAADYRYNRSTGILTIQTASFSPFTITYEYDGVASVNGIMYPSVNAAVEAAADGETITVCDDITTDQVILTVAEAKNLTIDMKGRTWNYTAAGETNGGRSVQLFYGANVTLKNGTINMPEAPYFGIIVAQGSSLTMKNVRVVSTDAGVFSQGSNNTVVIENSYIEAAYSAVYHNGSYAPANITIRNSEIVSNGDVGIYVSNSAGREKQTLTVENSTVKGTSAIEFKHTNASITGCTLIATNEAAYTTNNNGSTSTGYCVAVTSNGTNDVTTGSVTLSNNTYQPKTPGCDVFNSSASNGVNQRATINGYDNAHVLSPDKILPVCRIQGTDTVYYSAWDLKKATAATLKNKTVIIQSDEVLSDEIYLSGKAFTLDLNGHTLSLEYGEGIKPNNGSVIYIGGKNSNLTIKDSSEAQTGAVYGCVNNYANKVTSAVRVGNYGKLIINGGHFYGTSEGTSCIFVCTSRASSTKATVTINGGVFETASPSGEKYYVLNHEDSATAGCIITVNGGKFKNYNPGVTAVDPVNASTGKIVLGTGCTTTSKTIGSDTWYTVSK